MKVKAVLLSSALVALLAPVVIPIARAQSPEPEPPAAAPEPARDDEAAARAEAEDALPPQPDGPQATEGAAEATATAARGQSDDIVVTAQKRTDRMLDVPISVSVVSSESLKSTAAKNLSELQGVNPGVYFSGNTGYGGAPMAIRGTAGSNTALLDDPVAVYVDGVYLVSGTFATSTLLDIASIEVARGPQGTLQGRNATAGAVLVRTADPKPVLGGYARASLATPLEYRLEGALTGPILDSLSVRAAIGYGKEDGWAENTFNGGRLGSSESLVGRLVLLWQPSDPVRVRLASTYSRVVAEPAIARWAATPFNDADPNMPLVLMGTATPTTPLSPAERTRIEDGKFAVNRPSDATVITVLNSLEASYAFRDFADLISVTGLIFNDTVGNNDSDGLPRTDREGFNHGETDGSSFSEELRLQSNTASPLKWIVGGYYSYAPQDFFFRINNVLFTAPDRRYTLFIAEQESSSAAGFADATLEFLKDFALTLGGRYTYERRAFKFDTEPRNFDTNALIPPPPTMMAPAPYRPAAKGWSDFSYRAKLSYTPIDELMLYASYAKGFKSGGFNAFGRDDAFDPEYLRSAEIGAKAELPDRRGWLAASGYYNNYDDLQVRIGIPAGGVAIRNAADSTIKGFELEGQVSIVRGLSLQGNVAYADARFESFPGAFDLFGVATGATGNRLPRTPEWQYFAQLIYDLDLSDSWSSRAQVSYRWRDTLYYYQTNQDAYPIQGEPLGELGARITLFYDPIDLSVALFGTNLSDDRSVSGFSPNFNYPVVSFNKPRTLGIELEKQF